MKSIKSVQKDFTAKVFKVKKQMKCKTTFESVLEIMRYNGLEENVGKFLEPSMRSLLQDEAIKLGFKPKKVKYSCQLY